MWQHCTPNSLTSLTLWTAPQLEQHEEAEAELLALAGHQDASLAMCLHALAAATGRARTGGALKAAAEIILDRFAADATAPLRIVELLLPDNVSPHLPHHANCDLPMIVRQNALSAAAGRTRTGRTLKAAAENILERLAGNATRCCILWSCCCLK